MRSAMDCSGSSDQSQKYLTDAVSWFKENGIELYGINENPLQPSWTKSPISDWCRTFLLHYFKEARLDYLGINGLLVEENIPWLLYFWETRHEKTFTLLPAEFDEFLYLPQSPSVIIKNIFHAAKFDLLLDDDKIIEAIKLTNTCSELQEVVNKVLKNIL
jgi:hypothetical protein